MYSFTPKKFGSNSRLTGVLRSFLVLMIGFVVLAAESLTVHAATTDDMQAPEVGDLRGMTPFC